MARRSQVEHPTTRQDRGSSAVSKNRREEDVLRDRILVTPLGLRFPADMTLAAWENAGRQLAGISNSSMWCLGDWVAYGLDRYTDRYKDAIAAAGLDYQTLRNYVWVSRRFDRSRRRPDLSFQHHAEVASLPPDEQDRWLDRAAQRGWSRNQLRQRLRETKSRSKAGPGSSVTPRLKVAEERTEMWRRAAAMAGEELEAWIIDTLDEAARGVLINP